MSDAECWAAAWKELTLTTDPYPTWKKKGFPASSHWAKAKALGDQIGTDPLPPPVTTPPPSTGRFEFRGIYVRDSDFAACYPAPFRTMGLTAMECAIFSGTSNIAYRMNQLQAPDMAWSFLGHFYPSTTGGSFALPDTNIVTVVKGVAGHPRNSHRYYIADEPNLTGMTTGQQDLNRAALRDRAALIKMYDPQAVVALADYRQAQLDPKLCGRPGGMWGGVVDEVWLSGYPTPNVDQDPRRIPDQAAWCDAAAMAYTSCVSVHRNPPGGNQPAYPTDAQVTTAVEQVAATRSSGIMFYVWDQDSVDPRLATDPAKQAHIGDLMAAA